jgi:hypothetical protein
VARADQARAVAAAAERDLDERAAVGVVAATVMAPACSPSRLYEQLVTVQSCTWGMSWSEVMAPTLPARRGPRQASQARLPGTEVTSMTRRPAGTPPDG